MTTLAILGRLLTAVVDLIDARLVAFLRWQQRRWS
jgi:hypothetical protein